MNHNLIRLTAETQSGEDIFKILDGEILEQVLQEAKVEEIENEWKFILEGHSFKVSSKLSPKLSDLVGEVMDG